jgi:diguanylate cyclase
MPKPATKMSVFRALRAVVLTLGGGPQVLAFLPALSLGAFWVGGEELLLFAALAVPALVAASGGFTRLAGMGEPPADQADGLPSRTAAVSRLDSLLRPDRASPGTLAVFAVGLDDADDIAARLGPSGLDQILARIGARIVSSIRNSDLVADLGAGTFALVLSAPRSNDLETLLQLCARLQAAIAEPISLDGARIYVTASIGFCRPERVKGADGEGLLAAAEQALAEARTNGQASVRSFAPGAPLPATSLPPLADEIGDALLAGQITPWFQPQVRTDTGELSGVEALARWVHPERGLIPPSEFLTVAEEAGLAERLGAVVLQRSLAALGVWDRAGLHVPRISVNFATAELRNPGLVEKVRWELDRFDLAPQRLVVEVLETVMASTEDDTVVRNLTGLATLGCGIDLDDFGTGHAAIGNIRRFSVHRVKIDRSFVTRLDTDAEQQAMVSAILLMAQRLRLDTLAEGVETAAEHATLAALGCAHVQGFVIARPMPEAAFQEWVSAREAARPQGVMKLGASRREAVNRDAADTGKTA